MSAKFFQFKKNLFLAILLLVIFVLPNNALAENLLTVGSANSNLTGTDSAIFSNIGSISATTTSLIRLQKNGVDLFKVDSTGNVTMGNFLTSISAANVSNGIFGSLSGGGNFSFPGSLGIGTVSPTGLLSLTKALSLNDNQEMFSISHDSAYNLKLYQNFSAGGVMQYNWVQKIAGVDNNVLTFRQGNVGIGTTDPGAKLEVSGAAHPEIWLESTSDAAGTYRTKIQNKYNAANPFNIISSNQVVFSVNNSGFETYIDSGSWSGVAKTGIRVGGDTKLIALQSGNVGIGNPSPGYKLDVNGEANFGIGTTTNRLHNVSAPTYGTDAANKNYVDSVIAPAATTTVGLQSGFWTTGANSSIFNNNTGGVGIGTTNPSSKLHVIGDIRTPNNSKWDFWNSGPTSDGYIQGGGNGFVFNSYSATNGFNFTKGSSATSLMFINSSGNVGIGTTTPGSLLTIGNNLGLTLGGTIYGATANRYLDFTGVLPLSLSVPGPIKFGNTATACDSTNTGALRYDAVSGQSYLCDGSRWVNQKNCGLMTDDEGRSYNTVQIGGQCWMAENINIGTMLASGSTMPNTADQVIEKWCYNSDPANCAANGGLYHFDEAVRGSKVSGARGICPAGWHVPTDAEFNVLEKTVSGIIGSTAAQYPCNLSVTGWRRCADDNGADNGGPTGVGKSLKAVGVGGGNGAGNNLVGFEGKLSGYRNTDSSFSNRGSSLYLWSSSPAGSSGAWLRHMYSSYSTVHRNAFTRANGFSVRCVRD